MLNKIRNWWKGVRDDVSYQGYGYYLEGSRCPMLRAWISFLFWYALVGGIRRLICRVRGHRLVDNGSYANADSGAEHFCCTRCGRSWSHIYY